MTARPRYDRPKVKEVAPKDLAAQAAAEQAVIEVIKGILAEPGRRDMKLRDLLPADVKHLAAECWTAHSNKMAEFTAAEMNLRADLATDPGRPFNDDISWL